MRRAAPAGAFLCAITSLLVACAEDAPTAASGPPVVAAAVGGGGNGSCTPPGHPGGTIIDSVPSPVAWGVAVRDDGLAYFTELFEAGVGITSTKTRTVDGFIPTGDVPTGVAFSPDGGTAYVANQNATVSVIDVATRANVGTISTEGMAAFAVQVSPEGDQLFVGGNSTSLLVIDTRSRTIVKTVEVGYAPSAFAVAPDNRILYTSSFIGATVTELDMFSGQTLRTFDVGGTPQGMAVNRKGTHLYVANEQGYLTDVDLASGQLAAPMPLAGGGFGVGVTPDDNQAYIAIPSAGLVQVFSLQSRKLAGNITVGGEPRRIGFSRAGKIGAVTNAAGYLTFIR
jgi:YVTN family beta-propeller protein